MQYSMSKKQKGKPAWELDAARAIEHYEVNLDKLVDLSIEIAKQNGYAPFTTTIRAAWIEAVKSVTESLAIYFDQTQSEAKGPQAVHDYRADGRFLIMRKIAQLHRSMGITVTMYVGLLKHFRNIYLAEEIGIGTETLRQIRDFFDEVELAVVSDWKSVEDEVRIRELQERALASALEKDRYFAIFESLRSPAFLLSKSYELINANEAAAELFLEDTQPGEIVYIRSMYRKNLLQDIVDKILGAAQNQSPELWLITKRGKKYFEIRMRALHDSLENVAVGHVVLLYDITSLREEAVNARKSERGMLRFLATMSHEIRTPLHSVLGASELLRLGKPEDSTVYLDLLDNAGQALLQTLNNVLDYSKLENGLPNPHPENIHLAKKLQTFQQGSSIGAKGKSPVIRTHLDTDLPEFIKIDWSLTRQVLANITNNAVRADNNDQGVDLSVLQVQGSDRRLRFEVRDYGSGLPALQARALFRPFETIQARDTGEGGAGLGLAISHAFVEALGGEIGYQNFTDGTLVWFEIPFEHDQSGLEARQTDLPARDKFVLGGRRCLLLDDDPIGSIITASQLESLGLDVQTAHSIETARALCANNRFDLHVLDIVLPDGSGAIFVKEIYNDASKNAVFVALSANVEMIRGEKSLERYFDLILTKPSDLGALSEALNSGHKGNLNQLFPKTTWKNCLDGLSISTIDAMINQFEESWQEFQENIEEFKADQAEVDLSFILHRMAGSAALLGLEDLGNGLHLAETTWPTRDENPEFLENLRELEHELSHYSSWKKLHSYLGERQ